MEDLSLHVLDIAENGIRAGATRIHLVLDQDGPNRLRLVIEDNGSGMDAETARRALDPFFTTRDTRRYGLGLSLLKQAAEETGGRLDLVSSPGAGTRVTALFHPAHPDMKPVGDLLRSLAVLMAGNPAVRFILDRNTDNETIHFDSHADGEHHEGDAS